MDSSNEETGMISNTEKFLRAVKFQLKKEIDGARSALITEALAHGLGLKSGISLAQWSRSDSKPTLYFSISRFRNRLQQNDFSLPPEFNKVYAHLVLSLLNSQLLNIANAWELKQYMLLSLDTDVYQSGNCKPLWLGRAEVFLDCVLEALCAQREWGEQITFEKINRAIELEWLDWVAHDPLQKNTPSQKRIVGYLTGLPGYNINQPISSQEFYTIKQHIIQEVQIRAILNGIAPGNTYRSIAAIRLVNRFC